MFYCSDQPRKYGKCKSIIVWENGDVYGKGHVIAINPNRYRTWNGILSLITDTLKPSFGAVRNLIHLESKEAVRSFESLETNGKYIAVGQERLKEDKSGYKTLSEKQNVNQSRKYDPENISIQPSTSGIVPRIRKTFIFVMANGKMNEIPCKVVLNESDFDSWEMIQDYIARSLNIPEGIQYLYRVNGTPVVNPREIQNGCIYVAVPYKDKFINLDYAEIFTTLLPMREIDLKRVKSVSTDPRVSADPPAHPTDDLISILSPDDGSQGKAISVRSEKNSFTYEKSLQSFDKPESRPQMTPSAKGPIRVIQCRQSTKVYAPYGTIDIQNKIGSVKPPCRVKERPKIYCYDRKNFDVRVDSISVVRAILMELLNNVFRLTSAKTGKETIDMDNSGAVKNISGRVSSQPYPVISRPRQSSIDTGSCDLSVDPGALTQPEPMNIRGRSVSEELDKKQKILPSTRKEPKAANVDKQKLSINENISPAFKQNVPISKKCMDQVLEVHKICDLKEKKLPAPTQDPNEIKQSPITKVSAEVTKQKQDKSKNEIIQPSQLATTVDTQDINEASSPKMVSAEETSSYTSSESSKDVYNTYVGFKSNTGNTEYCYPSTCGFKKNRMNTNRPVVVQSPKEFIDDIINASKIYIEREWLASENLKMLNKPEFKSDYTVSEGQPRTPYNCCRTELEPVQEESSLNDDFTGFAGFRDSAPYDVVKQRQAENKSNINSQPCVSMPVTAEDLGFQIHGSQIDSSRNSTGSHLVASNRTDSYRSPESNEPLDLSSKTSMNRSSKPQSAAKDSQASSSRSQGGGSSRDQSPLPLDLSKKSLNFESQKDRSRMSQVKSRENASKGFLKGGSMTEKLQDRSKSFPTIYSSVDDAEGFEGNLIQLKKSELNPHNSNIMPVDCCDGRFQQIMELLKHHPRSDTVLNRHGSTTAVPSNISHSQKKTLVGKSILTHNEDIDLESMRGDDEMANPHMEKRQLVKQIKTQHSRIMDIPEIREYIRDEQSDDTRSQEVFSSGSASANNSNVTMVKIRNSLKTSENDRGCPETSLDVVRSVDQSSSKHDQDMPNRIGPAKCYCRQVSCQCNFDCIMRFKTEGMQTSRSYMSRESKKSLGRINEAPSYERKQRSMDQSPSRSGSSKNMEVSRSKTGNKLSAPSFNTPTSLEGLIIGDDSISEQSKNSSQEEFVQEVTRDKSSHFYM